MRITVTGGSGFIGRHLLRSLAELAAQPDRDEPLEIAATARDLSRSDPEIPGVRWLPLDLDRPPADPLAALGHPDVLVHLAWGGLPNYGSSRHLEEELPRHQAFLERAVRDGLGRIVVAGTCLEYGMREGRLSEELPTLPANPYATAKDRLRTFLEDLRGRHDLRLTWLRFFYLYGDGQPDRTLYAQLVQAIRQRHPEFDMSGGEQVRDYLPVTTATALVGRLAVGPGDHGVVNICSGRPRMVRALVEEWVRDAGGGIRLNLGRRPYSAHEPMRFWGSNDKLLSIVRAA